jgi:hypothetical protein
LLGTPAIFGYDRPCSLSKKQFLRGAGNGGPFAQAPSSTSILIATAISTSAQSFIVQAYQKLDAAQREDHDDLGGDAQRAKDLPTQADPDGTSCKRSQFAPR